MIDPVPARRSRFPLVVVVGTDGWRLLDSDGTAHVVRTGEWVVSAEGRPHVSSAVRKRPRHWFRTRTVGPTRELLLLLSTGVTELPLRLLGLGVGPPAS